MTVKSNSQSAFNKTTPSSPEVSLPRHGNLFKIGSGFNALAFRDNDFSGKMDPLVMVDHYRMILPTFGPHPHAGLSAVSVIFEDSIGPFHNRDSLGNDFDIMPGDLYWLKAGAGVIHDESPRPGSKIHGLQVFVNLPAHKKQSSPESFLVKNEDIKIYQKDGVRARIILGESNGIKSIKSPVQDMTIIDGFLNSHCTFVHQTKPDENSWIYSVEGDLKLLIDSKEINILQGSAVTISNNDTSEGTTLQFINEQSERTHFVLFSALPVGEKYIQKGPFIMSTHEEIIKVESDYAAGKLGSL